MYDNYIQTHLAPDENAGVTTTTTATVHGLPAEVKVYKLGAMIVWQQDNRQLFVAVDGGATGDQALAVAESFVAYTP